MQKEAVSEGFSAGVRLWLIFLLAFYAFGYPALLSIFFGALTGLAGGFVVSWWKSKDEPPPAAMAATGEEVVDPEVAESRASHRRQMAAQRQHRYTHSRRHRKRIFYSPIPWPFRRS